MSEYVTVEQLNEMVPGTLMESLGIVFVSRGEDTLIAKMPVDSRTKQPFGALHGGAILGLAESVGSALSVMAVPSDELLVNGMSVTANHIASVSDGEVSAHAKFIHKGRTTHVVDVKVKCGEKLISSVQVTNFIRKINKK